MAVGKLGIIFGEAIKPLLGVLDYFWVQEYVAASTIVADDVVYISGVYDATSNRPKVASASSAATSTCSGPLLIAMNAATVGQTVRCVPWRVKTGVNTSTSADGSGNMYLGTAGATQTSAGVIPIVVGKILTSSSTIGVYMNWPGRFGSVALPSKLVDPGASGAIPNYASGTVAIVTAAAETRTLAIPTAVGLKLVLICDTRAVGDAVLTAAQAINAAGNNTVTFSAARKFLVLESCTVAGALRWQYIAGDAALSTV